MKPLKQQLFQVKYFQFACFVVVLTRSHLFLRTKYTVQHITKHASKKQMNFVFKLQLLDIVSKYVLMSNLICSKIGHFFIPFDFMNIMPSN